MLYMHYRSILEGLHMSAEELNRLLAAITINNTPGGIGALMHQMKRTFAS